MLCAGGKCPKNDGIYDLFAAIAEADRAVFIVPNYCNYPCSNYFLFNERSQSYFGTDEARLTAYLRVPKKFIVVSNTEQENFTAALSQQIPEGETPDILFLSAKQYGKISLKGDLMDCPEAYQTVMDFLRKQ